MSAAERRRRVVVHPFFLRRSSDDRRVRLEVGGECDASTLDALNEALCEAVGRHPDELIVDLAHATFVDSLTLGALTAAAKQIRARGSVFRVVRVRAVEVRRAFAVTGLDTYLLAGAG